MNTDDVYFIGNGASGKIYKIFEYRNIYHVNFLLWKASYSAVPAVLVDMGKQYCNTVGPSNRSANNSP